MSAEAGIIKGESTAELAIRLSVRALERVLADLTEQYIRLRSLSTARLEAMRKANLGALGACVTEENLAVQGIVEVEKRRVRIVGELAALLGFARGNDTTLTQIAQRIDGPVGERLLAKAQDLRDIMQGVRRQNEVGAIVAERLARHMEGLWAQVVATLNHSKTYGRMGAVQSGPRVVSALDMTS